MYFIGVDLSDGFGGIDPTQVEGMKMDKLLKGLSVIVHSKLHFFYKPQIFLHIHRELHSNNLPMQQLSQKQHIFGKQNKSLLLKIEYPWQ